MDMIAAYTDVGSYQGAAALCGVGPKTVKRAVERAQRTEPPARTHRPRNTDGVSDVVAKRVEATDGRISAKRLLPEARAAGFAGSARNFRRLVAAAKAEWRRAPPGAPARRVAAGRDAHHRLGIDRPAACLLRRAGLEPRPLRALRRG